MEHTRENALIFLTHHCEVFSTALHATEKAGKQHVLDVVAGAVVELAHVKGTGLVAVKVGLLLQDLQDVLLHQVWVPDLIPGWDEQKFGLRILTNIWTHQAIEDISVV